MLKINNLLKLVVANRIIQTKPSSISPIRYKSPPLTASQRGIPLKKDVILDDKQESKEGN